MSELQQLIQQALNDSAATYPPDQSVTCFNIDRATDAVIRAIEASGRVTVDRARFERLLLVAQGAKEWFDADGESSNDKMHAEDALTWMVDALQPGDLETLP